MENDVKIKLSAFTLDCPDPLALATFYAKLLHWDVVYSDEEYACAGVPGSRQAEYPGLTFQRNPDYTPPVWPDAPGAQQQMAHLDIAVDDVEKAAAYALQCGATQAETQYSDMWRVMIDPVGHPFCLCALKDALNSEHCGLR